MQAPVKIAVIGGSGLIGKRHLQHIVGNPNSRIFGIVDPSHVAVDIAKDYSVSLFRSIDDLLAQSERPDAAIVCTPNHTHVPLSLQLVKAGIHILVEKPISIDASSAQLLIDTAKEHGVRLLVGHHRRFNPYVVAVKSILDSGDLGIITAVSALWTLYKPAPYFSVEALRWRSSKSNGGGVILINMIHEIDLMQYFFGPVTRVHAERTTARRQPIGDPDDAAEEGAAITLRFASGVVGTFIISDNVVSPHSFESGTGENPMIPQTGADTYRFFGTKGTVSFPDMTTWTYAPAVPPSWESTLQKETIPIPDKDVAPFDRQLDHFIRVVQDPSEKPNCSGEDGLLALKTCEAIRKALDKPSGTVELDI